MSITVFTIAFSIMMAGMIIFLIINFKTLPVVKAGKVTKICSANKHVFGSIPDTVRINGVTVNLSKDRKMLVCGNSMKDYHILDGQRIYVKEYAEEDKSTIAKYPVLVFHIVNVPDKNDAQYKLRKFVGYVKSNDWKEIYRQFANRIRIPEATFIEQCTIKYDKIPVNERTSLVLSETYDEDKHVILYSLHPVNTVYGKVEYAL